MTQVISLGMYLACASFFALSACEHWVKWNAGATSVIFLVIALLQGVAFGTMFPAFNTLFVNLGTNSQRGTATSTYLTSWDVGIGIGLMCGGAIAQAFGGYNHAYLSELV
ncbi:MAG: MFS transporter [Odoribacter splanchnicus]